MTALESARKAAEAAAAKLAEVEAEAAEKAAQEAAQRRAAQHEAATRFLADLPGLEASVRGEKPSHAAMATALEAGTLPALVGDYLARRDARQKLRDHARQCARLLDRDDSRITELRWVDPAEELRRWTADALYELRRTKADTLSAAVLSTYEVE
ncbi:hypothetical protein [Streptomyces sp. Z26]|uniref:hypothetical protein n=1 Tax=Streptomyces sp. Z26 TaxID=2500177 RepID=UPI000EF16815|nr:hypothetical protein [Streptomyces sp. Z26]RLL68175.1 hypothetical protein D7M15_16500 [Streptomyces sp. Z26]